MATSISFFARGDSSSANNAALNVENTSKQPLVELTFEASSGGDIVLEPNGGAPDPDTTVLINGVRYNFTLELTGGLPSSNNKVPDALEGKNVTVISAVIGGSTERFFFVDDGSGSMSLMNQFGNGAIALTNANFSPPPVFICYCTGTQILTPTGYRKIETLTHGDLVTTAEGISKPILWIGQTHVSVEKMRTDPSCRPIRIKAHSISPDVPSSDLEVSAQHRVVLRTPHAALLFGDERVMVRACHLTGSIAERLMPQSPVSFFHLLLEDHDVVLANGLEAESFQPSRRNYLGLSTTMKDTFNTYVKPTLRRSLFHRPDAMITLKSYEAQALIAYMFGKGIENASTDVSMISHSDVTEKKIAA